MRITENTLRKIIRNILLESTGNFQPGPYWDPDSVSKEVWDHEASFWQKAEPAYPDEGWTPDEDPYDELCVEAANKLGCDLDNLYIYNRYDEYDEYDEDGVDQYIDAFIPGMDPDGPYGVVVGEYIILKDYKGHLFLFTCSSKRKKVNWQLEDGEGWD